MSDYLILKANRTLSESSMVTARFSKTAVALNNVLTVCHWQVAFVFSVERKK